MRSSYSLKRFHKGLLHFAHVELDVETLRGEVDVIVLGPEVRTAQSRAIDQAKVEIDTWVAAAVNGIKGVLAGPRVATTPPRRYRVTIARLDPHWPDSSANAFECAAAMATFKALFPNAAEPRFELE